MRRHMPLFYGAILLTGVNLLLRLVSTGFQVHISARMGAAGVGLLQMVMSVGGLAMTAGIAGVRTATMYLSAAQLGIKKPGAVTWVLRGCLVYALVCGFAVGSILYFCAPLIADSWLREPNTVHALRIFARFLPVVCLTGVMVGYFTAANRIATLAAVEIGEQLCYMAATLSMLNLRAGTDSYRACEAVVLGSGISTVFTLCALFVLRAREKVPKAPRIPVARQLLSTAVPLALADDLKAGINTAENLMVPRRLAHYPGELSPLATFGTVCGMVFPIIMFPAAIVFSLAELMIPELAACHAAGRKKRIQYLTRRGLQVCFLYGCLCCGIIHLLGNELGMWIYQSPEAGAHIRRYSLLIPMLYCDAITDAMTKGLGQQKACVRYNILTATMDVALLFVLLPRYGMGGYFFSFTLTHAINFALSLRRLLKISNTSIPFYIPALGCSALAGAIMLAAKVPQTVFRSAAFLLILLCLWVLMKIVSVKELRWIKGLVKKK